MYDRSQFRRGQDVYDRDNNKIGDVSDVGPNYLHLSTGFLGLGQDLYIPFSAVDRVDDRGVYLNVSKSQMTGSDWSRPPTATGSTAIPAAGAAAAGAVGSTMRGTMPSSTAAPAGATITPDEARGHNMCDVNGKQIGSISGVGANYFHVVTGLLGLGQDLYVPIDAVDHCTRSCCYVNMSIDEMKSRGWTNRPAAGTTAAAAGGLAPPPPARPTTEAAGRAPVTPEGTHGVYRIPLREEEIDIHRHREQVGEVIVSKEIVEEQRTVNVPVSHEEVRIERHRVTGGEEAGPITDESVSQTIRVPVYEERIDVEKHPHVVEEVVVSPEETTRQERVTETVRREVPRVRTTGGADEFVEGEESLEGNRDDLEGRASVERTAEEIRREQQQQQRRAGE